MFARFVLTFLVLLSFLQEKSTWFLHPLYPFIALICGWWLIKVSRWFLVGIVVLAFFQLGYYRGEYIVPDVGADEAHVARSAKEFTTEGDVVYLTHYYYPTAVYYSRRTVYAVYSERPSVSWWILPKSAWSEILSQDRVFISTSFEDLRELERQFPHLRFEILFQSGDKLFVKKAT